ncbi:MAG: hypothetical protein IPM64_12580 [Phycisphaerales bacterium]|nr:hypothetical protein [Phycisphaerales bacterium]
MIGIGHKARRVICTAAVLSAALVAVAQDGGRTKFTSLLNVEALVDNYSRFLSKKYNLDEQQERFTNKLMHDKANAFLANHRDNLFGLVDRMFEVRTGGEMDPSELVDWGRQVAPVYEEAKRVIIDGNSQFREILNEEQRAIHDQDLRMMEDSFAQTDDQLRRIVSGEMGVEEFRNPRPNVRPGTQPRESEPPPQTAPPPPVAPGGVVVQQQPKTQGPTGVAVKPGNLAPARPDVGGTKGVANAPVGKQEPAPNPPPRPVVNTGGGGHRVPAPQQPAQPARPTSRNFEGEWDQYTAQFIQRFNLDDGQRAKAEAILKDCKEQATRYVRTREAQLNDMEQREAKLRQEPKQSGETQKQLQKIQQDRNKLLEPLTAIFEKTLKPRLDRLPTGKQRKDAESAGARPGGNPPRNAPPGAGNREARGGMPLPPPPPPPPVDEPQQGQPPPPPPPSEPTQDGEPSKPDE